MITSRPAALLALVLAAAAAACSPQTSQEASKDAKAPAAQPVSPAPAPAAGPAPAAPAAPAGPQEEIPPPTYELGLPEEMRALIDKTFTGDLDEMVKRRLIRVGVTFNRTFYFIDKGAQRGFAYEYATLFEEMLNKKLNTGNLK